MNLTEMDELIKAIRKSPNYIKIQSDIRREQHWKERERAPNSRRFC